MIYDCPFVIVIIKIYLFNIYDCKKVVYHT